MENGADVPLELSDNELGLIDYSLQTASFGSHNLRIFPMSLLCTIRRNFNVPHLRQVLITTGWQVAYFEHFTRSVQSRRLGGGSRWPRGFWVPEDHEKSIIPCGGRENAILR